MTNERYHRPPRRSMVISPNLSVRLHCGQYDQLCHPFCNGMPLQRCHAQRLAGVATQPEQCKAADVVVLVAAAVAVAEVLRSKNNCGSSSSNSSTSRNSRSRSSSSSSSSSKRVAKANTLSARACALCTEVGGSISPCLPQAVPPAPSWSAARQSKKARRWCGQQ